MMVTSCMDVENIEIDHIGGYATMNNAESEAYYANLRAYKATAWNYNRPVAFGWYSNLKEVMTTRITLIAFTSSPMNSMMGLYAKI